VAAAAGSDHELPAHGIGVTNLATRPTRAADELTEDELHAGAAELEQTVTRDQPRLVAIVGLTAYRLAFARPSVTMGLQRDEIGAARVWGAFEPERP
jgi:TDG/mug DNA glycosylase family protein